MAGSVSARLKKSVENMHLASPNSLKHPYVHEFLHLLPFHPVLELALFRGIESIPVLALACFGEQGDGPNIRIHFGV